MGTIKYSIGNGVARELIHMTHGYEQWWGDCLRKLGVVGKGRKIGTIVIAFSIKYNLKNERRNKVVGIESPLEQILRKKS